MHGYVFRPIAPRPTFAVDMSPDERATLIEHVAYWSALAEDGRVLAFGPVDDSAGRYGIGIVVAADRAAADELRDGDPAMRSTHGFGTEIAPMPILVTPAGTYHGPPADEMEVPRR